MATEVKPASKFGHPVLRYGGTGRANWARATGLSQNQKGTSGWQANLFGGVQSGDDWAAVCIPVNELNLPQLKTSKWSWYQTNAEAYGLGIVIWAHDPSDFDKRIEISQSGSATSLDKGAGQNAHEFPSGNAEFFFYGENTTGTGLTAGTLYTWAQFQADALFSHWTIYRISLEWGWYSTGTFEDVWVADLAVNNELIPLLPSSDFDLFPIKQYATATSGALADTLAPKTPFRLLSIDIKINTAGTTDESLTITQDAAQGAAYDRLILTQNTKTPAITSLLVPFGQGYEYEADDELDAAWPNTEDRTYGLVWTWEPL